MRDSGHGSQTVGKNKKLEKTKMLGKIPGNSG